MAKHNVIPISKSGVSYLTEEYETDLTWAFSSALTTLKHENKSAVAIGVRDRGENGEHALVIAVIGCPAVGEVQSEINKLMDRWNKKGKSIS